MRFRLQLSIHAGSGWRYPAGKLRAVTQQSAQGSAPSVAGLLATPALALRFAGQEALPPGMSDFAREQFFSLSSEDVTAIRVQFRGEDRLPAALIGRE